MQSGPPTASACSINARVTDASRPFSEAAPSRSRQATTIGRSADTHTSETSRRSGPIAEPSIA